MIQLTDQADGLRNMRNHQSISTYPLKAIRSKNRTIAITSGKGGVGKTQLSANLAVAVAKRGEKVVLLDADLGLASLDLVLGIKPNSDLLSVVRGNAKMEEILVEAPCGIHLMPACPGRYDMANLGLRDRSRLLGMVQEVSNQYGLLVIDTGAGLGATSVSFAAVADDVILVLTPDPTSLRDAYAMIKTLHQRHGLESIHFVANQVNSEREGLDIYDRLYGIVSRFLKLELNYLGSIPNDKTVAQAVIKGQPYVIGSPQSAAARSIETLIRGLHLAVPVEELC